MADPHHLPRWWPRVQRVEDVADGAFTEVMRSSRGRVVRADFQVVHADERERSLRWEQLLEGTPFQRVLREAVTELRLAETDAGTDVTIELRQALAGFFPRFGGFMVRRAAAATIEEALAGLERISG